MDWKKGRQDAAGNTMGMTVLGLFYLDPTLEHLNIGLLFPGEEKKSVR